MTEYNFAHSTHGKSNIYKRYNVRYLIQLKHPLLLQIYIFYEKVYLAYKLYSIHIQFSRDVYAQKKIIIFCLYINLKFPINFLRVFTLLCVNVISDYYINVLISYSLGIYMASSAK